MRIIATLLMAVLLIQASLVWGFSHNQRSMRHSSRLFQTFSSGGVTFKSEKLMKYFDLPVFLVIGASEDRSKFGNKVLRCMLSHKKQCVPFNKRLPIIEGVTTVDSLQAFIDLLPTLSPTASISEVGMNLITPPPVTLNLMRQGYELGIRNFFCQPGTVDGDVEVILS